MTTTSTTAAHIDIDITAEDAPIGTQLWPTRSPEFAPNFTLAAVETVRTETRTYVRWVYESGKTRTFSLGEQVFCRIEG